MNESNLKMIRINWTHTLISFVYTQFTPGQCLIFNKGKEDQGKVMIFSVILEDIISVFIILFFISLSISRLSRLQFLHSSLFEMSVQPQISKQQKADKRTISVDWTWSSNSSISLWSSSVETFSSSTTRLIWSFLIPKATGTTWRHPRQGRPSQWSGR